MSQHDTKTWKSIVPFSKEMLWSKKNKKVSLYENSKVVFIEYDKSFNNTHMHCL